MVNEKVLVRDKYKTLKKFLIIFGIIILIVTILSIAFFSGFLTKPKNIIVLENPLKDIVIRNTNAQGLVNKEKVIQDAVLEFNEDYINYLLAALGVNSLHKSLVGYGNPIIEFQLSDETWSSEIVNGNLITEKSSNPGKDLIISTTKEEAVEALLSPEIEQFMKQSVYNGNTRIEMFANKVELGSKGYLKMYTDLTGEGIEEEI